MLLFIDTNILLDFYRFEKTVSIDYVEKLIGVSDKIVMTSLVEMEFLKNRQKVIQDTLKEIKDPNKIRFPQILSNDRTAKSIPKQISSIKEKVHKIRQKVDKIVIDYDKNDKLYKKLRKIFQKDDDITLKRETEIFDEIYFRAEKRFNMGYPPRKDKDLSFGDAINWEWILEVCQAEKLGVIIVTRDSDYGNYHDGKPLLNDFLLEEFRRKVATKLDVFLSTSLTTTLKEDFDVDITDEEIEYEYRHMTPYYDHSYGVIPTFMTASTEKDLTKKLEKLNEDERYSLLESVVSKYIYEIVDLDPINTLIAGTNAAGWGIDEFIIDTISIEEGEINLSISFTVSAFEHMDDRPYCGDQITGDLEVNIYDYGYMKLSVIEADLNF